jgi:hypothetical protein
VVHLNLIFNFLEQECLGLKLAMFKEGPMETVIGILDVIAGEEYPGAMNTVAIVICYEMLSQALRVACSLTFITQGLDVGLLPASLRGGRYLMRLEMPPITVKIAWACFKQVHQLMAYRSFLRMLGKVIKKWK